MGIIWEDYKCTECKYHKQCRKKAVAKGSSYCENMRSGKIKKVKQSWRRGSIGIKKEKKENEK